MKRTTISVQHAARHFAEYVNRVRARNESFIIVNNGKPVARLIPETEKICTGKDLVEALERFELAWGEAKSTRKRIGATRKRKS